jgi:hypothetical protein
MAATPKQGHAKKLAMDLPALILPTRGRGNWNGDQNFGVAQVVRLQTKY